MSSAQHTSPDIIADQTEARERWEDLKTRALTVTPFDDFDFLDELAGLYGWSVRTVMWGQDLGVRMVERSRLGVRDIIVPPFVPFSSVLISSNVSATDRSRMLNPVFQSVPGLPDSRLLSFNPALSALLDVAPARYNLNKKRTYHLATGSRDEVLGRTSESIARKYKKAHNQYSFRTDEIDASLIAHFVEQAYERHGKRLSLPAKLIGAFCSGLAERAFSHTVGAFDKSTGDFEAGIILLIHRNRAWYWLAGSQPGSAMTFLIIETLVHLKEMGVQELDLMGANTPGISEFKRRFGGELVTYSHFSRMSAIGSILSAMGTQFKRISR